MPRSRPVDGFTLEYDRAGSGPPVVLLHGWPGSRARPARRRRAARRRGRRRRARPARLRRLGPPRPRAGRGVLGRRAGRQRLRADRGARARAPGARRATTSAAASRRRSPRACRTTCARSSSRRRCRASAARPRARRAARVLVPAVPPPPALRAAGRRRRARRARVPRALLGALERRRASRPTPRASTRSSAHYARPGAFTASIALVPRGRRDGRAIARRAPPAPLDRVAVPTTVLWPEHDPLFPRRVVRPPRRVLRRRRAAGPRRGRALRADRGAGRASPRRSGARLRLSRRRRTTTPTARP